MSSTHAKSLVEALPSELLSEIGEHLSGSCSLGSLASFNITCSSRDPEGFAEREKPLQLEKGCTMPKGWQFTRYLHVGKNNLQALEAFGETFAARSASISPDNSDVLSVHSDDSDSSCVSGDWDPISLQAIFPNLVLLVLRLREYDESIVHPQHARHFQRNSEVTDTTLLWATVCKPVQLSNLIAACVTGNDRRETFLADSCISRDDDLRGGDSDWSLEEDPRTQTVTEIVRKISFKSTGAIQPGGNKSWRRHIRAGEDNLLLLDTNTLDNDDSEGSRSRLIAQGIISLYADRRTSREKIEADLVTEDETDSDWEDVDSEDEMDSDSDDGMVLKSEDRMSSRLPLITLVGERVPFQPFLTELFGNLPLKAKLRVQSKGLGSPEQFVQQLDRVGQAFCDIWDQVQLGPGTHFFCWLDEEGVNEANGLPMSFSGNLHVDDGKRRGWVRGFKMLRMLHRLDGFSRFAMDEFFYQVKPKRKVTVTLHTERDMED